MMIGALAILSQPACSQEGDAIMVTEHSPDEVAVRGEGYGGCDVVAWDLLAQQMLHEKRWDDAARVINARLSVNDKDTEAQFMAALVEMGRGNYGQAIRLFRRILSDHPSATRVRLELGRAFFLKKDYQNALRQFHFALAGKPPPEVVRNINKYIYVIRMQRRWTRSAAIALAPDTNINTGSDAREVSLFGLPFDLSEGARKKSGIGLALEARTEFSLPVSAQGRLRIGASGTRREYSGSEFDDMTVSAYAGPRYFNQDWDASLLLTGYRRWYGVHRYSDAIGGRLEVTRHLSPRLGLNSGLSVQDVKYTRQPHMNGQLYSLGGSVIYTLTPASGVSVKANVARQTAQEKPWANWSQFVAAGYFRDLPKGFSVYIEPSLSAARYDEMIVAFGEKRRDKAFSISANILNRKIILGNFSPRLSYAFTKQKSNISLYRFDRHRFDIGLATVF